VITYPVHFVATAESESGIGSPWQALSQSQFLSCAIPPEFEGPGNGFSPEDIFAQALTNCFIGTFKVFAEKSKIQFSKLVVSTHLSVDLNAQKQPVMKSAILKVQIEGAANTERAKHIAERAFKAGFILNSVKTDLSLELTVS
jgi:organic hydroperoxide reductase OsmC/OhrA